MDGAVSSEALGNTPKPIDWIEEGVVSISADGVKVELDLADALDCWLFEVVVIVVESDGMTNEINSVLF